MFIVLIQDAQFRVVMINRENKQIDDSFKIPEFITKLRAFCLRPIPTLDRKFLIKIRQGLYVIDTEKKTCFQLFECQYQ